MLKINNRELNESRRMAGKLSFHQVSQAYQKVAHHSDSYLIYRNKTGAEKKNL